MIYRCPICKKKVKSPDEISSEQAKLFPFCSKRCKLLDLGAWFDTNYKICTSLQSQSADDSSDEPARPDTS